MFIMFYAFIIIVFGVHIGYFPYLNFGCSINDNIILEKDVKN